MDSLHRGIDRELPPDIHNLLWRAQEHRPRSLLVARQRYRHILAHLRRYDEAEEPSLASIQAGMLRISLRRYLDT